MAQNVTIAGASYSEVPSISVPKTGGGTASFTDVADTTAAASDVAAGKYFYTAAGVKTEGTASGGTAAISVVDTTDSAGGTIRTITALDISDTTAVAADVASGKYFYTAAGVKTQGTSSGGGGPKQEVTGTFTGSGGITQQISCSFAPDVVYVHGDLSGDPSLSGLVSLTIIKDTEICLTADTSSSSYSEVPILVIRGITGYNESDPTSPHATYSNGVLTIDTVNNTTSNRFVSGITYSYELVAYGSSVATQHTIHLEFTDSTDTDIEVDYDDALISTMITSYDPVTYGQKTVDSAALDGTVWYQRPTETWETIHDGNVQYNHDDQNDYPYCWLPDLASLQIALDSVWRLTYSGNQYRCTAKYDSTMGTVVIGNPKWGGGADDGSDVPLVFGNQGWGAWTGNINAPNVDSTYAVKIERLVTS